MANIVPEGTVGVARIEHYTVSNSDSMFTSLRAVQHPEEFVPAGDYCRLYVGHTLMMSDTQMEQRSNRMVVRKAQGNVLIAGLGVGLILVPILAKPEVKKVTVVEKYQDVIDLVGPAMSKVPGGKKLEIVQADIFEWAPPKGQTWDCLYFDIWSNISTDALKQMAVLHRKFARRKAPGAWMDSWKRDDLKYRLEQERRAGW